jgi:phage terminase small subunit
MCRFVAEYAVDCNGKRAAICAGYPAKTAHVMACKLLKHPLVSRAVGKMKHEQLEAIDLRREEIVEQLYYAVTRDVKDMVDENGEALSIPDMPKRMRCMIDGFEQEVFVDAETGDRRIKTKVKLSPKLAAIDAGMKYRALYAPEKSVVANINVDWESLYGEEPLKISPERERAEDGKQ